MDALHNEVMEFARLGQAPKVSFRDGGLGRFKSYSFCEWWTKPGLMICFRPSFGRTTETSGRDSIHTFTPRDPISGLHQVACHSAADCETRKGSRSGAHAAPVASMAPCTDGHQQPSKAGLRGGFLTGPRMMHQLWTVGRVENPPVRFSLVKRKLRSWDVPWRIWTRQSAFGGYSKQPLRNLRESCETVHQFAYFLLLCRDCCLPLPLPLLSLCAVWRYKDRR